MFNSWPPITSIRSVSTNPDNPRMAYVRVLTLMKAKERTARMNAMPPMAMNGKKYHSQLNDSYVPWNPERRFSTKPTRS